MSALRNLKRFLKSTLGVVFPIFVISLIHLVTVCTEATTKPQTVFNYLVFWLRSIAKTILVCWLNAPLCTDCETHLIVLNFCFVQSKQQPTLLHTSSYQVYMIFSINLCTFCARILIFVRPLTLFKLTRSETSWRGQKVNDYKRNASTFPSTSVVVVYTLK